MRFQHKKFLVILLASFLLCFSPSLIDFTALPASAYIHQQTIIRENGSSIDNLKDEAGNVWELIVWQEANQGDSDTYLRLVGCPLFQLDHNRPLQFSDATHSPYRGKVPSERWGGSPVRRKAQDKGDSVRRMYAHQDSDGDRILFEAEDLYLQKSPAFHVAKYSVKDILPLLPTNETLNLSFYLTGDRHVHLEVPPEVIAQWQKSSKIESKSDRHNTPRKPSFLLAQNIGTQLNRAINSAIY
ncbi:MAG: DUF3122 domain-containing protein [Cyanobacteria bacterium J06643_13]